MPSRKTWANRSPAYKARHMAKQKARRKTPEYLAIHGPRRPHLTRTPEQQKARRAELARQKRLAKYHLTEESFGRIIDDQKGLCMCCRRNILFANVILYEKKYDVVLGLVCRGCHCSLRGIPGSWHTKARIIRGLIAAIDSFIHRIPKPDGQAGGGGLQAPLDTSSIQVYASTLPPYPTH